MSATDERPDAEQGGRRREVYARDEDVDMSELRTLVALLDGESTTQIAARFGVARSTITRCVNNFRGPLEGLVRPTLHEDGRGFVDRWQPTERGHLVEPALRQIVDAYDRLLGQLERDSQIVRIGFIRPMRRVVQGALKDLKLEYRPGRPYLFRFSELTTEEQAPLLDSGGLDVAIAYDIAPLEDQAWSETAGDSSKSRFYARLLCHKQLYDLVVPRETVVNDQVVYERLSKLCYVALPARHLRGFSAAVNEWLASKQISPADTVQNVRATTIVTYAGSGRGFGFLPHLFQREFGSDAAFIHVPELPPECAIKAYVREERRTLLLPLLDRLGEQVKMRWPTLAG